jgi:DNA-binding CsgD family transcriptional regulator
LWTLSLPHRGTDATLYITADAAKTHRARLLAKLRTKNPVQLIVIASERGSS